MIKQLFLIEGILTIGIAIIFAFILPNSNQKILGMNHEELEWVRWNFVSEQGQQDDSSEISAQKGFIMAVVDPKTWLFLGTLYSVNIVIKYQVQSLILQVYIVGAVVNFFPSVVAGLGYDRNKTLGLTAVC